MLRQSTKGDSTLKTEFELDDFTPHNLSISTIKSSDRRSYNSDKKGVNYDKKGSIDDRKTSNDNRKISKDDRKTSNDNRKISKDDRKTSNDRQISNDDRKTSNDDRNVSELPTQQVLDHTLDSANSWNVAAGTAVLYVLYYSEAKLNEVMLRAIGVRLGVPRSWLDDFTSWTFLAEVLGAALATNGLSWTFSVRNIAVAANCVNFISTLVFALNQTLPVYVMIRIIKPAARGAVLANILALVNEHFHKYRGLVTVLIISAANATTIITPPMVRLSASIIGFTGCYYFMAGAEFTGILGTLLIRAKVDPRLYRTLSQRKQSSSRESSKATSAKGSTTDVGEVDTFKSKTDSNRSAVSASNASLSDRERSSAAQSATPVEPDRQTPEQSDVGPSAGFYLLSYSIFRFVTSLFVDLDIITNVYCLIYLFAFSLMDAGELKPDNIPGLTYIDISELTDNKSSEQIPDFSNTTVTSAFPDFTTTTTTTGGIFGSSNGFNTTAVPTDTIFNNSDTGNIYALRVFANTNTLTENTPGVNVSALPGTTKISTRHTSGLSTRHNMSGSTNTSSEESEGFSIPWLPVFATISSVSPITGVIFSVLVDTHWLRASSVVIMSAMCMTLIHWFGFIAFHASTASLFVFVSFVGAFQSQHDNLQTLLYLEVVEMTDLSKMIALSLTISTTKARIFDFLEEYIYEDMRTLTTGAWYNAFNYALAAVLFVVTRCCLPMQYIN